MAHLLTVTRIPEEKFRRFSRFPFVAATKIDKHYNNVYLEPTIYKPNTKSNVKVIDNPVPIKRTQEDTFDFEEITKASDKKLLSPSPQGFAHQLDMMERSKQITKAGKEENRGKSFIVVKKNILDSKNNEVKVRKAKEEDLDMLVHRENTRCPKPYDLSRAEGFLQNIGNKSAYDINGFEDEKHIKDATNDSDGKKTNIVSGIDAPKEIAEGDMHQVQAGHTKFPYQVTISETRSLQAGQKGVCYLRNTRYGGDLKITAYRPCTSIDKFRMQNLGAIKEVSCKEIEKGEQIWTQVDQIIENSSNRKKRMRQQLNQQRDAIYPRVAMETGQKIERQKDLKYAIELRPLGGCRNIRDTSMKNILSDDSSLATDKRYTEKKDQDCVKSESELKVEDRFESQKFIKNGQSGILSQCMECFRNYQRYPESLTYLASKGTCNGEETDMTTTTLPRITSSRTPLPTGITQPPPRSHSSASMYTAYPPKDLSSSLDYLRIPARINPLAPPPPRRRINWSWETTDQHYENEKRSLLMQKREHTRYHSAWSKAFYGAPAEKEAYRRHFREVLKQQMSDKNKMEKIEFQEKIKETEQAINYDRDCRMNDAKEYHRKHSYLMQYRDTNKQQMEDRWADTKYSRELENRIDRERLRYNPINWSCSLK